MLDEILHVSWNLVGPRKTPKAHAIIETGAVPFPVFRFNYSYEGGSFAFPLRLLKSIKVSDSGLRFYFNFSSIILEYDEELGTSLDVSFYHTYPVNSEVAGCIGNEIELAFDEYELNIPIDWEQ